MAEAALHIALSRINRLAEAKQGYVTTKKLKEALDQAGGIAKVCAQLSRGCRRALLPLWFEIYGVKITTRKRLHQIRTDFAYLLPMIHHVCFYQIDTVTEAYNVSIIDALELLACLPNVKSTRICSVSLTCDAATLRKTVTPARANSVQDLEFIIDGAFFQVVPPLLSVWFKNISKLILVLANCDDKTFAKLPSTRLINLRALDLLAVPDSVSPRQVLTSFFTKDTLARLDSLSTPNFASLFSDGSLVSSLKDSLSVIKAYGTSKPKLRIERFQVFKDLRVLDLKEADERFDPAPALAALPLTVEHFEFNTGLDPSMSRDLLAAKIPQGHHLKHLGLHAKRGGELLTRKEADHFLPLMMTLCMLESDIGCTWSCTLDGYDWTPAEHEPIHFEQLENKPKGWSLAQKFRDPTADPSKWRK